jgi:hypothetical protein
VLTSKSPQAPHTVLELVPGRKLEQLLQIVPAVDRVVIDDWPVEDNNSPVGGFERKLEGSSHDIAVVGMAEHVWLFREYVREVFL